MLIVLLIWFALLVVVAVLVLVLARAESHRDAFSASIPDGEEYDERRSRLQEDRRASVRVVAPRMAMEPVDRPASKVPSVDGAEPLVVTSSRVVEVHSLTAAHGPVVPDGSVDGSDAAGSLAHLVNQSGR